MPYYNDIPYYYGGGAFANHSSLMTGMGRTPFHLPVSRFSPHLSTISESPLNHLHRFSPISVRHVRRVIDTADIDVSSPRNISHDGNRSRNRLCRNRPTIKIRSQALKDNPALREHNEKHEKSVGELLIEKFYIKDKKSDGDKNQQMIHLYHQVSLDPDEKSDAAREVVQRRITRRFTRRRSSADLQLDPEQLQREVTYAQVQAKVLDSLVAEEQAQIENEVRRGTLIKKRMTKGLLESCSYANSTDDSITQEEEEEEEEKEKAVEARIKKAMKKAKKKRKPAVIGDKPSSDDRSSTSSEVSNDLKNEEENNDLRSRIYKIEACNSTEDFTAIQSNTTSEKNQKKCESTLEQYRESVRVPILKKSGPANVAKNTDETETQVILPVRKPYIKDPSRNSVYLTMRKPEELSKKLEKLNKTLDAQSESDLTNNFVNDSHKIPWDKVCKNSSELINKENKNEFLRKTASAATSLTNKNIPETKSTTGEIVQDAPFSKSTNSTVHSSVSSFVSKAKENAELELVEDALIANIKKNKKKENNNLIDSTKKSVEASGNTMQKDLVTKNFITSRKDSVEASRTDNFAEENNRFSDARRRSVVSVEADENSANSSVTLTLSSAIGCLPKVSKINTDRNNAVEAPELPLQETVEYLANSLKSAEDIVKVTAGAALPKKKVNKTSNLANVFSFNALKKTNGVNATTLEIDAARCDVAKSEIQNTTLLKETNDQVRSNDHNEKTESMTIKSTKDVDLTEKTSRNNVRKTNENVLCQISLNSSSFKTKVIDADVAGLNSFSINNIEKANNMGKTSSTDSSLSNIKTKDEPKLNDVNVKSPLKIILPKIVASPVEKDSKDLCKTIKVNNIDSTLSFKNNLNTSKPVKKSISIAGSFDTIADSLSAKLTSSNANTPGIPQQSAGKKKTSENSMPITNEASKNLNNISETEKKPINANCDKWQEESVQLLKSASTESIDFWSEIKTPSSPEAIRSKYQNSIFPYGTTMVSSEIEEKMYQDPDKFSMTRKSSTVSTIKEVDKKESETKISVVDSGSSTGVEVPDYTVQDQKEKEKVILEESCKMKKIETMKFSENIKIEKNNTVQKVPSKKKKKKILPIAQINNTDSSSAVKKVSLKHNDIAAQQSSANATPIITPEIILPVINIVEAPKMSEVFESSDEKEYGDPSTPTNELPPDSLLIKKEISKWNNQVNLINADDVVTPIASEETSLATSPNISPQPSKIKRTIKKKKPTIKKTPSVQSGKGGIKEEYDNESTITSKQNSLTTSSAKSVFAEKQLAKLSPQLSPKSSPRNLPSQRPLDLIRMFYTTPSALLTATPRDLSKVRRAKIKRRRHHSRTPSVNSDSTGSTTSTATTESTDGRESTCTELGDSEHKRMNSTRSNDSGFDGSPRISST